MVGCLWFCALARRTKRLECLSRTRATVVNFQSAGRAAAKSAARRYGTHGGSVRMFLGKVCFLCLTEFLLAVHCSIFAKRGQAQKGCARHSGPPGFVFQSKGVLYLPLTQFLLLPWHNDHVTMGGHLSHVCHLQQLRPGYDMW